jgi:hypothetical protein
MAPRATLTILLTGVPVWLDYLNKRLFVAQAKRNSVVALEKKGYRLRISGWVGRLGNHLIQLSCALKVAQQTKSLLIVPKHDILSQREYDFRDSAASQCHEEISGLFFTQPDCFQFPIRYDSERRQIFQSFVLQQLERRPWRERLHNYLSPSPDSQVDDKTLVINMRSGRDIFRSSPPPQNDYMQPPLSFYQKIIETNGYNKCLIVTEPDRANPVIAGLLASYSGIRVKEHRGVLDDISTVLSAQHLVLAHSTFTWCLALMSQNLKVLHQPHTCRVLGLQDYVVNTYEFANYIQPGEWTSSTNQLAQMLGHPVDCVQLLPAGSPSEPVPSACW